MHSKIYFYIELLLTRGRISRRQLNMYGDHTTLLHQVWQYCTSAVALRYNLAWSIYLINRGDGTKKLLESEIVASHLQIAV